MPKIKGISGMNVIGATSGVDPIQRIIAQIQAGAGAGYQSGQALGMNLLNLLARQQKATTTKATTPKITTKSTGTGIEKLTTQLNTLDREESRWRQSITGLEKNITDLETKKIVRDIPQVMLSGEEGEKRIQDLMSSAFTAPVPRSKIISELNKNNEINKKVRGLRGQIKNITNTELTKILNQKDIVKQKLGLLTQSQPQGSINPLELDIFK